MNKQENIKDRELVVAPDLTPALNHLDCFKGVLPNETIEWWKEQVPSWKQRERLVSAEEFGRALGMVPREAIPRPLPSLNHPDGKPKTKEELVAERKAINTSSAIAYGKKLEQWMPGANLEYAANHLISDVARHITLVDTTTISKATQLSETLGVLAASNADSKAIEKLQQSLEKVDVLLPKRGNSEDILTQMNYLIGARARLRYERSLKRLESKISKLDPSDTSLLEKLKTKRAKLALPEGLERFHVRSTNQQHNYWESLLSNDPEAFIQKLAQIGNKSFLDYEKSAKNTTSLIGTANKSYFAMGAAHLGYIQGWMQEEPGSPEQALKGFTILLTRENPNTHLDEMLVGVTKRDAYARTHQLTAFIQTSISNEKLKSILDKITDALNGKGKWMMRNDQGGVILNESGIPVACVPMGGIANNGNRLRLSNTGHIAINFDALENEQQKLLISVGVDDKASLKSGQKVLSHNWLSNEQIDMVTELGLVDADGRPCPGINPFLASTTWPMRHLRETIMGHSLHQLEVRAQQENISSKQFLKALSDPSELELIRQKSNTIYVAMIALFQKNSKGTLKLDQNYLPPFR